MSFTIELVPDGGIYGSRIFATVPIAPNVVRALSEHSLWKGPDKRRENVDGTTSLGWEYATRFSLLEALRAIA